MIVFGAAAVNRSQHNDIAARSKGRKHRMRKGGAYCAIIFLARHKLFDFGLKRYLSRIRYSNDTQPSWAP
jgi:hypothetical protein